MSDTVTTLALSPVFVRQLASACSSPTMSPGTGSSGWMARAFHVTLSVTITYGKRCGPAGGLAGISGSTSGFTTEVASSRMLSAWAKLLTRSGKRPPRVTSSTSIARWNSSRPSRGRHSSGVISTCATPTAPARRTSMARAGSAGQRSASR